jgi:transglutaminase-like putative cysteine protease
MLRKMSVFVLIMLAACAVRAEETEAPAGKSRRKFQFSYKAVVKDVPADAKIVDLWIPVPQDNAHQKISDLKFDAPAQPEIGVDAATSNKIAHWQLPADKAKGLTVTMTFVCDRQEVAMPDLGKARDLTDAEKAALAPYLKADKLVLVGGEFSAVADAAIKDAKTPAAISKAAYDHTVGTMKYDKPKDKQGWGQGSTKWACDAKFGNCTDFHALFMSISRTKGIPVKFEMGFPLPEAVDGKPVTEEKPVGGYHCWAKFYLGKVGWVPIDASEAQKNPKLAGYYYGNLTADRVQVTVGRDVNLVPRQKGEPLNYFIYPYAEADGKKLENDKLDKAFRFKDVQ